MHKLPSRLLQFASFDDREGWIKHVDNVEETNSEACALEILCGVEAKALHL
jgi:hypothetical protein